MDVLTRDVARLLSWPWTTEIPLSPSPPIRNADLHRPTYWAIARRLRISPVVAKERLRELSEQGVITKIRLIPSLSLIPFQKTTIMARAGNGVSDNVGRKSFDFVEAVHIAYRLFSPGDAKSEVMLLMDLLHSDDSDLQRKIELLKAAVGDFSVLGKARFTHHGVPINHDATDFSILEELRRDPFIKIQDLAEKVKISRKTVAGRLTRLIDNGAFYLEPALNSKMMKGTMLFIVSFVLPEANKKQAEAELSRIYKENWLFCNDKYENLLFLACCADNFEELEVYHDKSKEFAEKFSCFDVSFLYPFSTIDNPSVDYQWSQPTISIANPS